jgi:glycosyltransferase involved in cell wall biosynthesis
MAPRVLTIGNLWPPAGGGGYERIWVAAVEALREAGSEVRVLTSDAPAPADDAVRELRWYSRDGAWLRPGPLGAWSIERHNARVLAEQLRAFQPDAVLFFAMGGMSLSLVERVGIPAVGVVGDGWMVYGPDADAWMRLRRRRPRLGHVHWLFISQAARERAGAGLPRAGLAHPGVDPAAFPRADERPWDWRLAMVGRIAPEKGVDVALAALEQLPEATLLVDGPGEHAPVERVEFRRSATIAVAHTYAEADVILFPVTWPEPWGLVPLEAMSVGRPVVATATGGAAEYLRDGVNALVVDPGDPGALAAAVRRLAGDAGLRARLRAGGFETAARYTQASFCAAVVDAVTAAAAPR